MTRWKIYNGKARQPNVSGKALEEQLKTRFRILRVKKSHRIFIITSVWHDNDAEKLYMDDRFSSLGSENYQVARI